MDIVYIPKEEINKVWVLAKPYVDDALVYSNSHHHSDHFKNLMVQGKLQLWLLWDDKKNTIQEKMNGVVVSEIINRSIKKVFHLPIVTGKNRQRWQHLIEKLENFAKDQGCDCMELIARPGWQKILDKHNYFKTHVVLEKNLKEE
jgi:hypothetical protein